MSADTTPSATPVDEPVDAEVVHHHASNGAVAAPAPHTRLAVAAQVEAAELVQRLAVIKDAMTDAMQEGVDYGNIPGTKKPALFKPGAEKLAVLFQLDPQLEQEETWLPNGHLRIKSKCTIFHMPTGMRMGLANAMCSTLEKKYAKRQQARKCPHCKVEAIIKGKVEYGGGWICFKKKDGCGAKFEDDDPAIVGQQVGEIDNPELADAYNTVIKMADKRALVAAVLITTGASALFTQDIEEGIPDPDQAESNARAAAEAASTAAAEMPKWTYIARPDLVPKLRKAVAYLLDVAPDDPIVNDVGHALEKQVDSKVRVIQIAAIAAVAKRKLDRDGETNPAAATAAAKKAEGPTSPAPAPDPEHWPTEEVGQAPPPGAGVPFDPDMQARSERWLNHGASAADETGERPVPGSRRVRLTNTSDQEQCLREWRAAGCLCVNPTAQGGRDGSCPIVGHGIVL